MREPWVRCEPEFVQGMRKHGKTTEFACWVKNTTPQAIKLNVPLGVVNGMPRIDLTAYGLLIGANRARYCSLILQLSLEVRRRAVVALFPVTDLGEGLMQASPQ